MSLAFLFHYLMLNMFRMLIHHPQELATYLLSYFMGCIALVRCVLVLRCGLAWVVWYESKTTHEITQQISRKILKMDVLTSETC